MFGRKKKQSTVTKERILAAMSTVIEPELGRDMVSLNMVRDIEIDDNNVTFTIMLTTPACPLKHVMQSTSETALRRDVPEMGKLTIKWDANVPQNRQISDLGHSFKNTIAVASGKGGVGKSTVAVNLAIALAKSGATVGLLDADILGPNVPQMMGVTRMPPMKNRKIIPAENYGVKFFSTAFLVKSDQALVWRGPMLNSAIRQFLTDVEWGELDYLIADLPPGTGDAPLSLAQALPLSGAVIVTQPMSVAAGDALRSIKMFESLKVPILGVIENMSGELFGSGAGEKLASANGVDYFGEIPLDARIRIGGDEGKPITAATPTAPASKAFMAISQKIAAKVSVLAYQNQANFIPIEMIG
ncbi:MAG TPA: iron-sulfur cluster carrier protein ApbC [Anaerolineae bacterium]|nr:iron-sulfur cluster carrier protein ApbC [Anaerolineae bacterium]